MSAAERFSSTAVLLAALLVGLAVIFGGLSALADGTPRFTINPREDGGLGLKAYWCAEYPDGGRECCYSPSCAGGGP